MKAYVPTASTATMRESLRTQARQVNLPLVKPCVKHVLEHY
jgi:hypothetical protein